MKRGGEMKEPVYKWLPYVEIRRHWHRDGAHPYPGVLVREERITKLAWVRRDEARQYGVVVAKGLELKRRLARVRKESAR